VRPISLEIRQTLWCSSEEKYFYLSIRLSVCCLFTAGQIGGRSKTILIDQFDSADSVFVLESILMGIFVNLILAFH